MATKYTRRKASNKARGIDRGAALAQSAAALLFEAYSNQQGPMSPASEQWGKAWDQLHGALGVMASDPAVVKALGGLDAAHGAGLIECEDRAWYAAWTAATCLVRGGGAS